MKEKSGTFFIALLDRQNTSIKYLCCSSISFAVKIINDFSVQDIDSGEIFFDITVCHLMGRRMIQAESYLICSCITFVLSYRSKGNAFVVKYQVFFHFLNCHVFAFYSIQFFDVFRYNNRNFWNWREMCNLKIFNLGIIYLKWSLNVVCLWIVRHSDICIRKFIFRYDFSHANTELNHVCNLFVIFFEQNRHISDIKLCLIF